MHNSYRSWLQQHGYSENTVSTQHSHAVRLEHAYGSLEEHYAQDRCDSIMQSLHYSKADSRRDASNPSQIVVAGDIYESLASFRTALGLYRRFLETGGASSAVAAETTATQRTNVDQNGERIGLERDLQKALRREINQLETGLSIIDDGVERTVASG